MTYKDEEDWEAIHGHRFYWEYLDEFIANWSHIDRVDELIDVLKSLEDNEVFCRFGNLNRIGDDKNEVFRFNKRKLPFWDAAYKGLGHDHLIPLYVPEITRKIVNRDDFICMLSIIQLSFVAFSGHYLKYKEDKMINLSDIICFNFFC